MEQSFDKEIRQGELEGRLTGQQHSRVVASTEILKLKKRISELEKTVESLDVEIEKTKEELKKS